MGYYHILRFPNCSCKYTTSHLALKKKKKFVLLYVCMYVCVCIFVITIECDSLWRWWPFPIAIPPYTLIISTNGHWTWKQKRDMHTLTRLSKKHKASNEAWEIKALILQAITWKLSASIWKLKQTMITYQLQLEAQCNAVELYCVADRDSQASTILAVLLNSHRYS